MSSSEGITQERRNKENRMDSKKRKFEGDAAGKITSFFSKDPTKTKKVKQKSELEMLIDRATQKTPQCGLNSIRPSTPPPPPRSLNQEVAKAATKEKETTPKKKKKEEKSKTPVRKPRSAFGFFFKSQKSALQKIQPSLKYDDLKKEARNLWGVMDTKARAPFEGMARKDRERYKKESAAEMSSPSKWQEKKKKEEKKEEKPKVSKKKRDISKTRSKARSPFVFYDLQRRSELRKLNPDKKYTELIQIARLEWDGMSAEKRAPFVAMSNKEKEEVRKANPKSPSKKKTKKVKKTTKSPSSKTTTIRAPRKAKNAFEHFSMVVKREIKDKIQDKEEQVKHIQNRWSLLSSEDRAVYVVVLVVFL